MNQVRFGELYSVPSCNGLSRPSRVRGQGYKMINMGELFSNDIISDMEMERVPMSENDKKKYFVNEGDLLFARQSLVASGAGKCSIIQELTEPTTFESHLIRVRLDRRKCNPWFYFYLFQLENNPVKSIINQCAQAGIRGSELAKLKVPYLDVAQQDEIVGVLKKYDDLIRKNNAQLECLACIANEIYKEWFVRFRYPGHEESKMIKGKFGRAPEDFKIINISDVLDYYIGGGWGNDDQSEEYPIGAYVIRGTDFPNLKKGIVDSCPYRFHKTSNYTSRELKAEDIILEVSGGTADQPVGRTLYISQNTIDRLGGKVICASFCKQLRVNSAIVLPMYFAYWMQFLYDTRIIDRFQVQSTGIINFKFDYFLRKGEVLLPPMKVMKQFESVVMPIHSQIEKISQEIDLLKQQKRLLLPRLISGKTI